MKRGRNQRRRQGGGNPNRALDSNGPDVRIRGTANQIHEKYQNLARDAQSSGDRVKAENYLQHAEHYFRVMRAMQPSAPAPSEAQDAEGAGEQPSVGDDREKPETRERRPRPRREDAEPAAEVSDEDGDSAAAKKSDDDDAGDEKKPRRRRQRRTPKTDASEGAQSDAGAEAEAVS